SPRLMCPSEARTCQRIRYSPGTDAWACDASVSAGGALVITRDRVEESGRTSVKRERLASMRTLKRKLMGMPGPATVLYIAGVDSNKMACAMAVRAAKNMAAPAKRHTAIRTPRPGRMTLHFPSRNLLREKVPAENYGQRATWN